MKTYIKIAEGEEIIQVLDYRDSRYELIIDSIDLSGFIEVELTDEQIDSISNRTKRLSLIDGQVVAYQATTEELAVKLLEAKEEKIAKIIAYDSSNAVNCFYVSGMPMWLDKATRTSLAYTIEVEAEADQQVTRLWYDSQPPVPFDLPIPVMRKMLSALEQYAKVTYDVTQGHKAAVYGLETVEEVQTYDYTAGYPEKLSFEL
ncbi:DUF4376 domain-containing protein [Bacteroides sp. 51]|uniref:DUF4376 domain-containing protein n=1 Tax=Bacteroides sp. 51 TaxID=2302938 RepID=UPI0013D1E962|nr:DUF4376 domain-containing protein [Bacteroides sp. 51]NDV81322.1 DUF4376 domain-containing protein [Bacteroides sp. 51]